MRGDVSAVVSATTSGDGTTSGSFTVLPQADSREVQVATAGRCAAATFPRVPLSLCLATLPARPLGCPVVVTPDGIIPVVIGPGGTPTIGP